ncbi:MAG: PHP domain-containing protein [bacterium]
MRPNGPSPITGPISCLRRPLQLLAQAGKKLGCTVLGIPSVGTVVLAAGLEQGPRLFAQRNFGISLDTTAVNDKVTAGELLEQHPHNYYVAAANPAKRALMGQRIETLLSSGFSSEVISFIKRYISDKYGLNEGEVEVESVSVNGSSLSSLGKTDKPEDIDVLVVVNVPGVSIREIVFDFPGFHGKFPAKVGGMIIESSNSLDQQSQHTHTVVGLISHLGSGITLAGKKLVCRSFPRTEKLSHALALLHNSASSKDLRKKMIRLYECLIILQSEELYGDFSGRLPAGAAIAEPEELWAMIDSLYLAGTDRDTLERSIDAVRAEAERYLTGHLCGASRPEIPATRDGQLVVSRSDWKEGFVGLEKKTAAEQLAVVIKNHDFNVWLNLAWHTQEGTVLQALFSLRQSASLSEKESRVLDWALANNLFLPEDLRQTIVSGRKKEVVFSQLDKAYRKINRRLAYIGRIFGRELDEVKQTIVAIVRPVGDFDRCRGKKDLHVHTVLSDGVHEAEAVMMAAIYLGLEEISLTDHNVYRSLSLKMLTACGKALRVRPGMEMDSFFEIEEKKYIFIYMLMILK